MTLTEAQRAHVSTSPAWSGINHLALITNDMDATVRFYHGVLGARLASTVGTSTFRHYFFDFGPHCTVAFFEYVDLALEPFAKPAGVADPRAVQFDHLALNLPDEDALHDLRQRLIGAGCEVTEIIDHGSVRSVYFTDPNGIALEASWWVRDVTGRPASYDNELFGDPNPVAALQELRSTGTLATVPSTRLA
ncbi:MAG: VOC family protein [Streptomyces sp.]|uniref:VOC family protein n=1 Tax=Streptomyces sp. TaxID=1931 RepID=UPI0025E1C083|nr:VOC family protein [Streptomyces sp.]MBW8792612.1 VOC family protein [Streptomyces sp.]